MRYCFLGCLLFFIFSADGQTDRSALVGEWVLVAQEQEDNLHEPTAYDDRYKNKTIQEAILIKKLENLGKVRMDFKQNGQCNIEQYGNKRKESYEWNRQGLLVIGSRKYHVRTLDQESLILEDRESTLFNLNYYYLPAERFDEADEEELLTFTHYDSLVIQMAGDRRALRARKDLYRNPHHRPEFEGGWEAFEKYPAERFGERFISKFDSYKGNVQISKLTFVVETDGSVSHLGSEVSQTEVYEFFQELFKKTGDKWKPGTYKGESVPCLVEYIMKLKDD